MSLIVKNTTGSAIEIRETGDTVPASGQLTIDSTKYQFYAKADTITEITTAINAGDIVINDGVRDLIAADALQYLRFKEALGVPFRSDPDRINGFTKKNVQEAIEEVGTVVDPLRVPISLIYNGTLSNGDFIGYSNLLPGDATPIIVPITGSFVEFTWSNNRTSADFALEFRRNTTVGTPFFTWSVDNTQTAAIILPSSESFNLGDEIYIKYVDEGSNARDAAIVLLFKS